MAINITAAGTAGTHSMARTNVNLEEDYIYYKNTSGVSSTQIPARLASGSAFIYSTGVGAIPGLTDDTLYYVLRTTDNKLQFATTSGGTAVDLTGAAVAGNTSFNTPFVNGNKLSIESTLADNQAVRYLTNGDPLGGLTSGNVYYIKASATGFGTASALYSFTSHTFTTCGVTGRFGPNQAQMRAAYSTTWDETYLSQGTYQGYQDWTVPVSGTYEMTVSGAAGFNGGGAGAAGSGATVKGRVFLNKGEVITIAVGQVGTTNRGGSNNWVGSGGGTFVVRKASNAPLFIAGGGSSDAGATAGQNGQLTNAGGASLSSPGGTAGNGGPARFGSGGGGGFFQAGFDGNAGRGGGSFANGLVGADATTGNYTNGGYGGFGGGGSADGNLHGQSGGAGGYSGGAGGFSANGSRRGGGGGSFIVSTATSVATSDGTYDGLATFNGAAITNLSAFNASEGSVAVSLVSAAASASELYPTGTDANAGTNQILITPNGTSYHALLPVNVDLTNDRINSASAHGLTAGEAVTYSYTGTPVGGLTDSTIYYVDRVDNYTYRLSLTPSPSFTTINLTAPASAASAATKLNRVVVNTTTDTLTINNHGFLVNQPIQYDAGGGTPISPLQDLQTYYVSEVVSANQIRLKVSLTAPNSINFTAAGTGTTHSFIFVTVNLLEDTLYIPNHGLVSGQAVRYSNGGGTTIGGLTNGATYYVIKVDDSIVRLASNKALTTIVNLSSVGTGTQSLVITSLDYATDTITVPNHGFLAGELIQYDSRGQTVVNGLTTATPYYVIFIDGDNIKLATTPENAEAGIAVNLTDTPAGVGRHTLTSLSKTPDGIYNVAAVPSSTTFTAVARGLVPNITKTFNPRTAIDLNLSAFKINSHGFITGTEVVYGIGPAATTITGLTDATSYYIVSINRDYFRLATSAENAASGITLTVSDFGTGVAHEFVASQINGNITGGGTVTVAAGSVLVNGTGTSFSKILKVGDRFRLFPPNVTSAITFAAADVNTTTNQIGKAHSFTTGDTVAFSAGGGVAPSPLVDGYYYFVRAVSGSAITLHSSAADAEANTNAADFTTQGTGSAFTLTRTTPVGPIIRRITAIGSDTQITPATYWCG